MSLNGATRRTVLGGSISAAGAVLAAACGPIEIQSGGQSGQQQSGGKAKVVWLVRSQPWENKGQEQIFEPAIKKAHPNIEIERVVAPQYIPKINAMAAANESLEIWGFGGNYYDYWWRGLPQDLTPYINADKWNVGEYFQPGLMDIYKINNKNYGLSQLTTYGSMMVYNKDLFDKERIPYPPVDWEDASWTADKMLEYAIKLTKNFGKPDAQYGVEVRLWLQATAWPYLFGGDSWAPEHYTQFIAQKTNFNSEPVLQGHQFAYDLIFKHQVSPDVAARQSLAQLGPPFKTGRLAMSLDGGWQYWQTSDIKEFKLGYAALPKFKTTKNINFNDFWIMGRWSKQKDAAWKVMRVLTSAEATSDYSRQSLTPPTPRASLNAWLGEVTKFTGQSVADLTKVTTGAIVKSRSQESPDHLFIQHPKIAAETYDQELSVLLTDKEKPATWVPRVAKILDETVKGIYDQFKDSRPKD